MVGNVVSFTSWLKHFHFYSCIVLACCLEIAEVSLKMSLFQSFGQSIYDFLYSQRQETWVEIFNFSYTV
jgi:hypothetical protein